ncbi:hypothetical protein BHE74_00051787 [Ensete ventricosum]|nr:hypothetical protein BHE74_00051787 [Ensete ventricosum]
MKFRCTTAGMGQMSFASSNSESYSIKVLARRSRALGCPSRDPKSVVVPSSSGSTTHGPGNDAVMFQC